MLVQASFIKIFRKINVRLELIPWQFVEVIDDLWLLYIIFEREIRWRIKKLKILIVTDTWVSRFSYWFESAKSNSPKLKFSIPIRFCVRSWPHPSSLPFFLNDAKKKYYKKVFFFNKQKIFRKLGVLLPLFWLRTQGDVSPAESPNSNQPPKSYRW